MQSLTIEYVNDHRILEYIFDVFVSNFKDVERLIKQLRPWTIGVDKIIGYNHVDLIIGKNVDEFVNTKILRLINRYSH